MVLDQNALRSSETSQDFTVFLLNHQFVANKFTTCLIWLLFLLISYITLLSFPHPVPQLIANFTKTTSPGPADER